MSSAGPRARGSSMPSGLTILGIAGSHNSGVALIRDGRVVVAVQSERLTRNKRQSIALNQMTAETAGVINYCLRAAGIDLPDVDLIAATTPLAGIHPRFVFKSRSPSRRHLLPPFITVPHHLAHAEYALHYSPLVPCLVLVCDGSGTYEYRRPALDIQEHERSAVKFVKRLAKESISAYAFDGEQLRLIYRVSCDDNKRGASIGWVWEWGATYCHGSHHEAGKLMGLAPFGDPAVHADLDTLSIDARGAVHMDLASLDRRFRTPNTTGADVTGNSHYEHIAAHVQRVTNDCLVGVLRFLRERHDTSEVCYSGGVALNGIANEHIRSTLGLNLYMNGSCEDNGTAIGAALAAHHARTGIRVREDVTDYLGREYSATEIEDALRAHPGAIVKLPREELLRRTAAALASGRIVGWFQGRSEFGPRALGNRSILADPRAPQMQEILNRRVKHREAFRPYAPAVVEERAGEFFEIEGPSPLMLRVVAVKVDSLPGITHVDRSARVQTVSRRHNPIFYDLLCAFEREAGVPVLLNTSFNVSGEPIVESPADAVRAFATAGLDMLVMHDYLICPC
jgi:carbamoyltransferase